MSIDQDSRHMDFLYDAEDDADEFPQTALNSDAVYDNMWLSIGVNKNKKRGAAGGRKKKKEKGKGKQKKKEKMKKEEMKKEEMKKEEMKKEKEKDDADEDDEEDESFTSSIIPMQEEPSPQVLANILYARQVEKKLKQLFGEFSDAVRDLAHAKIAIIDTNKILMEREKVVSVKDGDEFRVILQGRMLEYGRALQTYPGKLKDLKSATENLAEKIKTFISTLIVIADVVSWKHGLWPWRVLFDYLDKIDISVKDTLHAERVLQEHKKARIRDVNRLGKATNVHARAMLENYDYTFNAWNSFSTLYLGAIKATVDSIVFLKFKTFPDAHAIAVGSLIKHGSYEELLTASVVLTAHVKATISDKSLKLQVDYIGILKKQQYLADQLLGAKLKREQTLKKLSSESNALRRNYVRKTDSFLEAFRKKQALRPKKKEEEEEEKKEEESIITDQKNPSAQTSVNVNYARQMEKKIKELGDHYGAALKILAEKKRAMITAQGELIKLETIIYRDITKIRTIKDVKTYDANLKSLAEIFVNFKLASVNVSSKGTAFSNGIMLAVSTADSGHGVSSWHILLTYLDITHKMIKMVLETEQQELEHINTMISEKFRSDHKQKKRFLKYDKLLMAWRDFYIDYISQIQILFDTLTHFKLESFPETFKVVLEAVLETGTFEEMQTAKAIVENRIKQMKNNYRYNNTKQQKIELKTIKEYAGMLAELKVASNNRWKKIKLLTFEDNKIRRSKLRPLIDTFSDAFRKATVWSEKEFAKVEIEDQERAVIEREIQKVAAIEREKKELAEIEREQQEFARMKQSRKRILKEEKKESIVPMQQNSSPQKLLNMDYARQLEIKLNAVNNRYELGLHDLANSKKVIITGHNTISHILTSKRENSKSNIIRIDRLLNEFQENLKKVQSSSKNASIALTLFYNTVITIIKFADWNHGLWPWYVLFHYLDKMYEITKDVLVSEKNTLDQLKDIVVGWNNDASVSKGVSGSRFDTYEKILTNWNLFWVNHIKRVKVWVNNLANLKFRQVPEAFNLGVRWLLVNGTFEELDAAGTLMINILWKVSEDKPNDSADAKTARGIIKKKYSEFPELILNAKKKLAIQLSKLNVKEKLVRRNKVRQADNFWDGFKKAAILEREKVTAKETKAQELAIIEAEKEQLAMYKKKKKRMRRGRRGKSKKKTTTATTLQEDSSDSEMGSSTTTTAISLIPKTAEEKKIERELRNEQRVVEMKAWLELLQERMPVVDEYPIKQHVVSMTDATKAVRIWKGIKKKLLHKKGNEIWLGTIYSKFRKWTIDGQKNWVKEVDESGVSSGHSTYLQAVFIIQKLFTETTNDSRMVTFLKFIISQNIWETLYEFSKTYFKITWPFESQRVIFLMLIIFRLAGVLNMSDAEPLIFIGTFWKMLALANDKHELEKAELLKTIQKLKEERERREEEEGDEEEYDEW